MDKFGCSHYIRKCAILSPCCGKWFICNLCHDEAAENNIRNANHCKVYKLERGKIKIIKCLECQTEQAPSQKCVSCDIIFGHYFCSKCNLFESNPNKNIFHCDKCGLCLIGKQLDSFHCDVCNLCLPLKKLNNHICMQNAIDRDCSICCDSLKFSGKQCTYFRECGHWIHKECSKNYFENSKKNKCCVCSKTLIFQSQRDIENFDLLSTEVMQLMKQLPEEIRERQVSILCNQCNKQSIDQPLNLVGQKCTFCGCYNTQLI